MIVLVEPLEEICYELEKCGKHVVRNNIMGEMAISSKLSSIKRIPSEIAKLGRFQAEETFKWVKNHEEIDFPHKHTYEGCFPVLSEFHL
jgi:hypothetical protein